MGKGYRQGRLSEEIKKIVGNMLLHQVKDPRLSSMISISDCLLYTSGTLVGLIDENVVITDEQNNELKFPAKQVAKTCLAVVF